MMGPRLVGRQNRKGSIVMFIVMFMALLALLPVGMQLIQVSARNTKQFLNYNVEADNVARAGMTDAISWFQRQSVQPVRSNSNPVLYPYPDAAFMPIQSSGTVTDTIDSTIGLVKEYALSDQTSLYARYEVKRQQDPGTNPIDPRAVHDITDQRIDNGTAGQGLAWLIQSTGYVYQRKNSAVAYNVAPNVIVGSARVSTEIRRIALTLPLNAALITNNRTQTTLNNNGRAMGQAFYGMGYYTGGSGPTISGGGSQLTGTAGTKAAIGSGPNVSFNGIFGVTRNELKLMADIAVSTFTDMPFQYPQMAVVYVNCNADFDATRPLRGGGILFVNGTLTLEAGSNTYFGGIIYATGAIVVHGPATINGVVVGESSITLDGFGDVAEVDYDNNILNAVRQTAGQYRENKATFFNFTSNS